MTDFKDWNEAHLNGYRARTAADFIWKDAESQAEATGTRPGADCDGHTQGGDRIEGDASHGGCADRQPNGRGKRTQVDRLIEIATGIDVELYHTPDWTTYAEP
jgi:hypothetical protein